MSLNIEKLIAKNVKRLKIAELSPDRSLVVIQGNNGNGKTSLLDSIAFALEGKRKADQPNPIREGADSATIFLDLGDLKVERTFKRKGGEDYTTKLTVEKGEGLRVSSPQGVLDAMLSKLSFDPLNFLHLKAADQVAVLQDLVPDFDFNKHAEDRQRLYDQRTEAGRDLKHKEGELASFAKTEGEKPDRVDVQALTDDINNIHTANNSRQAAAREYEGLETQLQRLNEAKEDIEKNLEAVNAQISEATEKFEQAAKPEPMEDPKPLIERLHQANQINKLVETWEARDHAKAMVESHQIVVDDLTEQIAELDRQKRKAIVEAKLPVEGLSLTESYVEFNGQPFDQASHAEQLRTSIAIAMSGDPEIRVLCVKDGSLLDENSLKLLEDAIADTGWQVWIEMVGDASPCGFTMVDGEIRNAE